MSTLLAFTLFLWVELLGFDNTLPDYGVDGYLGRMVRKPDAVSLLLNNERLFRSYSGEKTNFKLPVDCCSYWARPYNSERRRQEWTADQLKGLVAALKERGVETYASFFTFSTPLPTDAAEIGDVSEHLRDFLSDFGFAGLHCSDGFAPPSEPIPACPDRERVEVVRKSAVRYADNIRTLVEALHSRGLKMYMNSCWTRDPFEALYRYGVDYRLLAKTGVDGFVVESSATAQELEGGGAKAYKSSAFDRSTAMLLRVKAAAPEVSLIQLHAINDGTEQWSALRHSPSGTRTEALALGTAFYNGKRALDGYLACLADGISAEEWKELDKAWSRSFVDIREMVGVNVVWSDRVFDREFEECVMSHDANSNTLLFDLISQGLIVHSCVSSEYALSHEELPLLILNPEFYPAEELAALRKRRAYVYEFGRGARGKFFGKYVPHEQREPSLYWRDPLLENKPPEGTTRTAAMVMNWQTSPYEYHTLGVKSWCVRLPNGRLGIFARNDNDIYSQVKFIMHNCVSDVQVHTDFPTLPVQTALETRIAPMDTVFFSVGEKEYPLPDATKKGQ